MVERLLQGHRRVRAAYAASERTMLERLAREGQRPMALYIGCSDSRVVPELLTGSAPGDLFVVRNVANRVPPRGSQASVGSAIEFAVAQLDVGDVIVCGHDRCGGVLAALAGLAGLAPDGELGVWLQPLAPAVARARARVNDAPGLPRAVAEENVLDGIDGLRTYPLVAERVAAGRLRLHGWVYDVDDASLRVYDAALDRFVAASADGPA